MKHGDTSGKCYYRSLADGSYKIAVIVNSSITWHRCLINVFETKESFNYDVRVDRSNHCFFSTSVYVIPICFGIIFVHTYSKSTKIFEERILKRVLFCSIDRAPRRSDSGSQQPLVIWLQPGNIEDLSNLPLPDLVQSAVDQLPPPSPHVTVSVPSSPMRDATFQFPECNVNSNGAPLPSPRPRPRRRFASESSVMETGPTEVSNCNGTTCRCHLGLILNERQSWTSVGANLRNIAGDFHACRTKVSVTCQSRVCYFALRSAIPIRSSSGGGIQIANLAVESRVVYSILKYAFLLRDSIALI